MGRTAEGGLSMEYPVQVINPQGDIVCQSKVRYPTKVELDQLDTGYTIKINGRRLTKTELRRNSNAASRNNRLEK